MKDMGCTFQNGRADAAAQLHHIHKNIKNAQQQLALMSDGDHCNDIEPCDEFDWKGAGDHSIDSLTHFVEGRKDMDMKSAVESRWR